MKISRHPISLDRPVGESEDSYFGDFIEDEAAESPINAATQEMLKEKIDQVLKTLTYREREIIKLRYGLGDGYTYTLEEVGPDLQGHPRAGPPDRGQGGPQTPASRAKPAARGLPREYRLNRSTTAGRPERPAVFFWRPPEPRTAPRRATLDALSRHPSTITDGAIRPMSATAEVLRDLHLLHQRAKALRDRLASAPRTLAARQTALAARQADLEKARKALQDAKVQLKKNEHSLQASQTKIDDLKAKLNQVKKNEEYKALQNQIAHDRSSLSKIEDEILQGYEPSRRRPRPWPSSRPRSRRSPRRSTRMQKRDRVPGRRRTRRSSRSSRSPSSTPRPRSPKTNANATAGPSASSGPTPWPRCENGACLGCFTAVTTQMLNHLINADQLMFCKSCGRLLYMGEHEEAAAPSGSPRKAEGDPLE